MQRINCVLDRNRFWLGEVEQKHHVSLADVSEFPVDILNVLMRADE